MQKKDLRPAAGLSTNVIAKLGKNENVSMKVLGKSCKVLQCEITDIMEFIAILQGVPEAVKVLQMPPYQADQTMIQKSFMTAVQGVKKEFGNDLRASRQLTSEAMDNPIRSSVENL